MWHGSHGRDVGSNLSLKKVQIHFVHKLKKHRFNVQVKRFLFKINQDKSYLLKFKAIALSKEEGNLSRRKLDIFYSILIKNLTNSFVNASLSL